MEPNEQARARLYIYSWTVALVRVSGRFPSNCRESSHCASSSSVQVKTTAVLSQAGRWSPCVWVSYIYAINSLQLCIFSVEKSNQSRKLVGRRACITR